jgi:hypothetical protein
MIRKDLEGSGRGIILRTKPALRKTTKSLRIAGLWAEI